MNLECYLYSKGFNIVDSFDDNYLKSIKKLNKNTVINQIEILSEFHKNAMGCYFPQNTIKNKIGKTVLYNRTSLRKLNLFYEEIKNNPGNSLEEYLLKSADILIRCEKSLNNIYLSEYLELIKRSMRRNELCIKNSYLDNLRKMGKVELINKDNICYDLVEIDALNLFIKLRSKKYPFDYKELIKCFVQAENLSKESSDFLEALLSYPYYFVRYTLKYIDRKKGLDLDFYKRRLVKGIEKDGESLI